MKGGSGGAAAPQEGSDDGGSFPTTLDIWRSPGPTCPGAKYPVRGIPHFDMSSLPLVMHKTPTTKHATETIASGLTMLASIGEAGIGFGPKHVKNKKNIEIA